MNAATAELKVRLVAQTQRVAGYLLPAGHLDHHEWRAGSVLGEAGQSLGVHLVGPKAGLWKDFSTGEGGDLIALWMAARRLRFAEALKEIRTWLGMERTK